MGRSFWKRVRSMLRGAGFQEEGVWLLGGAGLQKEGMGLQGAGQTDLPDGHLYPSAELSLLHGAGLEVRKTFPYTGLARPPSPPAPGTPRPQPFPASGLPYLPPAMWM